MNRFKQIEQAVKIAKQVYGDWGVDVDEVCRQFDSIPVSIPCWQGDDVGGFEPKGGGTSGGIMATGNYPGKPRTVDELRSDMEVALKNIPGQLKINLHASYGEDFEPGIDRDDYAPSHFKKWVEWAIEKGIGVDFNCTTFGHPLAQDHLTISSPKEQTRSFWIKHMIAARRIATYMGKELGQPCVYNTWVQDGMKDMPADRKLYRRLMKDALDQIFAEKISSDFIYDALEPKLFGIGVESFTVGSHDFYLLYHMHARSKGIGNTIMNLDMGHFHPTEQIGDKISAVMLFSDKIMAHFTRSVRWDSDHVVINDDTTNEAMREIVRAGAVRDTFFGTDYFDATINRVAAWIIGTRAVKRALLAAMLEPADLIKQAENDGDYTKRLAIMDEVRSLPANDIWNKYCMEKDVPLGTGWLDDVRKYEADVMLGRS